MEILLPCKGIFLIMWKLCSWSKVQFQQFGSLEEIKKVVKLETQKIDLQGKTLLPAFIDSHSHITALAQVLGLVNLSKCTNFEEIRKAITNYKEEKKIQEGEWIIGFGYNHNFLKERKHPTKIELDKITINNPILITHTSGHMGATNSLGLERIGINKSTLDPEGGFYERIEGSREPNGYMEENAFMNASKKTEGFTIEKLTQLAQTAQEIYLKNGITTVQDGLVKKNEFELLQYLAKNHKLIIDVVGYVEIKENKQIIKNNPKYVKRYYNRLKLGGYKLILDGSPQGKTAWMTKPYEGETEYRGYPAHTKEQVEEYVESSLQEDLQLLTHCNGDAAADQLIEAFKKGEKKYSNKIRPIMIHAQTIREDQIEKMKQIGIIPSYFMAHIYYWGDIHLKNLGERAYFISPAETTREKGLYYTLHQDTPVIYPNMLETIWCAVNRKTKDGVVLGEEEKIEVYEALKAVTIYASYQYFEEDKKGTLEEGKLADLVILDKNPLTIEKEKLKEITILETIKEGKTLYKN